MSEGSRDQLDLSIALQSAAEPFRSVLMILVATRVNVELELLLFTNSAISSFWIKEAAQRK